MLAPLARRNPPDFSPENHYIRGDFARGAGEVFEVGFPVTGEVLASCRGASPEQVEAAVAAARESFDSGVWRGKSPGERAAVLEAMAGHLAARLPDLARRVMFDNAKTADEAAVDVYAAMSSLRSMARACQDERGAAPPPEKGVVKMVWREPVGVVAALTPFNAPLMFVALKAAPALAAGNSVVLKPSERAPLVTVALAEAADAAGVPPGVLNLLQGDASVAAALCEHSGVDMITITGGTPAGSAVMRAAAPTIKNLLLELGGKSAHVVLADADLDAAIPAAAAAIFRNAGQRCFSGSRLIVEEAVADEVEGRIAEIAEALNVGDPFEEGTEVGCLIDERALEGVAAFVETARSEGLRVASGGRRAEELGPGAFYRPTLLTGARSDSHAAQEEVFGPVLTSIRVRDADEAVRVANASRYGLAGGVWTRDMDKALKMAREVRCGYFWINTYGAIFGDVPFGGYGQSGVGREAGRFGFEAYTELKTVLVDTTAGATAPRFGRKLTGLVQSSDASGEIPEKAPGKETKS